jgi:hypothetical protein
MLHFKYSFYFIASLFLLSCGGAKNDGAKTVLHPSIFDEIYESDMPVLTLSGDLSHLIDKIPLDENNKEQYFSANLTIGINDSSSIELPLRIAKRGITRKSLCDFPPMKFKFQTDTLEGRGYSKMNTYKFVTHCIPNGDELVVSEFLAYKLFNHLSDKSFRVKMVMIKYDDLSRRLSNLKDGVHYGFIIEEDEELAYRLDAKLFEGDIDLKYIDHQQYALMVVFQYMIGNTDWNLKRRHNIKWIQGKGAHFPASLPYDFDFSGLVNAPHAAPHPKMPIKTVRERFLQWRGKTKVALNKICEGMIADKENILNIVKNEVHLSEDKKIEMIDYLNSFFKEIETTGI